MSWTFDRAEALAYSCVPPPTLYAQAKFDAIRAIRNHNKNITTTTTGSPFQNPSAASPLQAPPINAEEESNKEEGESEEEDSSKYVSFLGETSIHPIFARENFSGRSYWDFRVAQLRRQFREAAAEAEQQQRQQTTTGVGKKREMGVKLPEKLPRALEGLDKRIMRLCPVEGIDWEVGTGREGEGEGGEGNGNGVDKGGGGDGDISSGETMGKGKDKGKLDSDSSYGSSSRARTTERRKKKKKKRTKKKRGTRTPLPDKIYRRMRPALQLASLMIENSYPWFFRVVQAFDQRKRRGQSPQEEQEEDIRAINTIWTLSHIDPNSPVSPRHYREGVPAALQRLVDSTFFFFDVGSDDRDDMLEREDALAATLPVQWDRLVDEDKRVTKVEDLRFAISLDGYWFNKLGEDAWGDDHDDDDDDMEEIEEEGEKTEYTIATRRMTRSRKRRMEEEEGDAQGSMDTFGIERMDIDGASKPSASTALSTTSAKRKRTSRYTVPYKRSILLLLAMTITHEVCHRMYMALSAELHHGEIWEIEPFWKNTDYEHEAGYSWENWFFGGMVIAILDGLGQGGLGFVCWESKTWTFDKWLGSEGRRGPDIYALSTRCIANFFDRERWQQQFGRRKHHPPGLTQWESGTASPPRWMKDGRFVKEVGWKAPGIWLELTPLRCYFPEAEAESILYFYDQAVQLYYRKRILRRDDPVSSAGSNLDDGGDGDGTSEFSTEGYGPVSPMSSSPRSGVSRSSRVGSLNEDETLPTMLDSSPTSGRDTSKSPPRSRVQKRKYARKNTSKRKRSRT